MKTTKELETVLINNINLDVHFSYTPEFGFVIDSIEDITGVQDLTPILSEWVLDKVESELEELYKKRGWL